MPAPPPTRRASGSPYEGATTGRRLGNWVTTRDAINSVWYESADQLVARSRDIIRKDGWASKAVDEWVCNAIGTGIKPQSMHPKLPVKEKLQALWSLWANEADAAGMTDIYGLQALAFRSMVEGGGRSVSCGERCWRNAWTPCGRRKTPPAINRRRRDGSCYWATQ